MACLVNVGKQIVIAPVSHKIDLMLSLPYASSSYINSAAFYHFLQEILSNLRSYPLGTHFNLNSCLHVHTQKKRLRLLKVNNTVCTCMTMNMELIFFFFFVALMMPFWRKWRRNTSYSTMGRALLEFQLDFVEDWFMIEQLILQLFLPCVWQKYVINIFWWIPRAGSLEI